MNKLLTILFYGVMTAAWLIDFVFSVALLAALIFLWVIL